MMNHPHWNHYSQPHPYQHTPHHPQRRQMGYMQQPPMAKKRGFNQQLPYQSSLNQYPKQQQQQPQSFNSKKPSLIKSAFTGEDGNFDVGRTFQTVDQVVKTVQQVSPIVKQVSPLVKQVSAFFVKK
ncbi:YppG family protein [Alkalihalophilus pseudofirmus]|uniref:YppG family protein n=1 Tax=Alkalihalophilus pseudofirmus TaxID=79885 RepID=UPI00259BA77D|nr:YppG family protein [Alkalihalophilus pseudofirmus]WEG15466.1 YppG family protein [Alkalihalophilus pseudofirmus]